MASLAKESGGIWRIHWRFRVRAGPRTGYEIEGSLQLGRCTKTAAKARLRETDAWLAERALEYTEQTLTRATRQAAHM